jgi:hypothetical protein
VGNVEALLSFLTLQIASATAAVCLFKEDPFADGVEENFLRKDR